MFLIPHETVWEKALSKRIFYWNSPWAFWTPGARTGFNRSLERQGFFTSAVGPRLALALWTDPLHREEVVALRQTHLEVGSGCAGVGSHTGCGPLPFAEWSERRNQQRKPEAIRLIFSAQSQVLSGLTLGLGQGTGLCQRPWRGRLEEVAFACDGFIFLCKQPKVQNSLGSAA